MLTHYQVLLYLVAIPVYVCDTHCSEYHTISGIQIWQRVVWIFWIYSIIGLFSKSCSLKLFIFALKFKFLIISSCPDSSSHPRQQKHKTFAPKGIYPEDSSSTSESVHFQTQIDETMLINVQYTHYKHVDLQRFHFNQA